MPIARWIAMSVAVAIAAVAAIMLGADYYHDPALLAVQIPALALPIATPLIAASLSSRHRAVAWTLALTIEALGWGYVVYVDTRPYQGGGASMAAIIGWLASGIALSAVIGLAATTRLVRTVRDPRWQRPPDDREG